MAFTENRKEYIFNHHKFNVLNILRKKKQTLNTLLIQFLLKIIKIRNKYYLKNKYKINKRLKIYFNH